MKHWETHPTYVEGCWSCRICTVSVAASAMPSRHPEAVATNAREARWNQDMPAYKRLRQDGLQPAQIDGCAALEKHAEHEKQIEMSTLGFTGKQAEQADAISRDIGVMA